MTECKLVSNDVLAQAIVDICSEAMRERNTKSGYMRLRKNLMKIGLDKRQIGMVLFHLNYAGKNGEPYPIFDSGRK